MLSREKSELASGQPHTDPHRDRRLLAKEQPYNALLGHYSLPCESKKGVPASLHLWQGQSQKHVRAEEKKSLKGG
ncbi:MAG: hypothetical protein NVS1B11_33770 [Terriglobales bacterium]